MSSTWARAALQHCAFHGLPAIALADLTVELAPQWEAAREDRLLACRGRDRRRAAGAGRRPKVVFLDALLITLAYLRTGVTQDLLAVLFDVDQATISRAVRTIRPLISARGYATGNDGPRLRTLADVLAYAQATGFDLCLDATDIIVRRPQAARPGRKAFVSGSKRRNTIKGTVVSDQAGRLLWAGALRPGRMHDQTAIKTEGIDDLLDHFPGVRIWADQGYRGLANKHPGQVITKLDLLPDTADKDLQDLIVDLRKLHCQQRIPIEQVIGRMKNWTSLTRWHGHRATLPETFIAVATLVSDLTATR
ncbi:transposase family protein [Hamadaea sp. NPDC051192]|uniref:transposase family protein n=1 Tax=Hamadaea sp. NPDC051192 TaxID=3154940 RepID=UPI00342FAE20